MNTKTVTKTNCSVYLVPCPIVEGALQTLSPEVATITGRLKYYFVENMRTARRFLRALHAGLDLDSIHFSEIDKHSGPDLQLFCAWLTTGHDIGILSEAGCPGIADPGTSLVLLAQQAGATVAPLTGPNSLILALMASGLNGQSFCFHGYLPVKEPLRSKRIKELELQSAKEKQTQLFIETPYRNNQLFTDLLKNCHPATYICIAQNISAPDAFIKTKMVKEWMKQKPDLEKQPAVFLMLA